MLEGGSEAKRARVAADGPPALPPLGHRRTFAEWCSRVSLSAEMLESVPSLGDPHTRYISLASLRAAPAEAVDAIQHVSSLLGDGARRQLAREAVERLRHGHGRDDWTSGMDRTGTVGACLAVACEDESVDVVRGVMARAGDDEYAVGHMLAWREDVLRGRTTVMIAAHRNDADIMQELVRAAATLPPGSRASLRSPLFTHALASAAARNCVESVRVLVRGGVCVDAKDAHGNTPLHNACAHGHVRTIAALLHELHADASLRGGCGGTPAHAACLSGHTAAVRALRETLLPPCNADDDARVWMIDESAAGQTPLTALAWRAQPSRELLHELRMLGADPNAYGEEDGVRNCTPLGQAVHSLAFHHMSGKPAHEFRAHAIALAACGARVDLKSRIMGEWDTPLVCAHASGFVMGGERLDATLQHAAMRSAATDAAARAWACGMLVRGLAPAEEEEEEEPVQEKSKGGGFGGWF